MRTNTHMKDRLVPADAIREIARGSFEHLSLRLDNAIEESSKLFGADDSVSVARVATFPDRVIVGTSTGNYFSTAYEDVNGSITLKSTVPVDVGVVGPGNLKEYIDTFTGSAVDALLSDDVASWKDKVLALASIDESVAEEFDTDLATAVRDIIVADMPWKRAYNEQSSTIKNQVNDLISAVEANTIEIKYLPLYDGTISEDKFPLYRDSAEKDLKSISSRLEAIESRIEKSYLPFAEKIANPGAVEVDEKTVVQQFVNFAESLVSEVHVLREHVGMALEHEQCVMCLGQIHDAIAESLNDYEIAGHFVERMATRFNES